MHVRSSSTLSSTRSESAHEVQAWTQFEQASIAAATSATPNGTLVGDASNIDLVSVTAYLLDVLKPRESRRAPESRSGEARITLGHVRHPHQWRTTAVHGIGA
jgi:hypothetical protein